MPAGPGYWGVFAHADVKRVLRDPQTFSSHLGGTQIRDPETRDDLAFVRAMMLNQDPPAQSRLRRIVAAAFTPRAIRRLEETIAERARVLVDVVLPAGRADFVEVAADLPVWTLARIMGVPDEDRRRLYDSAYRVIGYQDADYAGLEHRRCRGAEPAGPRGARRASGLDDPARRPSAQPALPGRPGRHVRVRTRSRGCSLAISAAHTLADSLANHRDVADALRAYEHRHRKLVAPKQRTVGVAAGWLVPKTRLGIAARNLSAKVMPSGPRTRSA